MGLKYQNPLNPQVSTKLTSNEKIEHLHMHIFTQMPLSERLKAVFSRHSGKF